MRRRYFFPEQYILVAIGGWNGEDFDEDKVVEAEVIDVEGRGLNCESRVKVPLNISANFYNIVQKKV